MAVDTREPNRNYPVPDPENLIAEEFPRLAQALEMAGGDIGALFAAVAAKAPLSHTHTISQITGLQAALDGKQPLGSRPSYVLDDLTDVDTAGATTYQVLARIGSQWIPWTVDLGHSTGFAAQLATSVIDAAQVTTGVLDPARIPVLAAQNTIVSTGAIANLSSAQQDQIATGTHVTTTDGRRWIYKGGGGSKTAEASYIELADVTPEWSVIANKPFGAFGLTLGAAPDLATAKTALALVKGDVGLSNVDNTSDLDKTKQYACAFAHRSGGGDSTIAANTWTRVNLGTLAIATNGFSISGNELLVPKTGIYNVNASIYVTPVPAGAQLYCGIYVNGSQQFFGTLYNAAAGAIMETVSCAGQINVGAGAKVALYWYTTIASSVLKDTPSGTYITISQEGAA